MKANFFWKMFFWITSIGIMFDLYSQLSISDELQYQSPIYLSLINILIIPILIYGLYLFAYSPKNIPLFFKNKVVWDITLFFVFSSAILSLYFEFITGNYLPQEMIFISIISFLVFLPYGYVLINLSKKIKRTSKCTH